MTIISLLSVDFLSHSLAGYNNDDVIAIEDEMAPEDAVDGSQGHALFEVGPTVKDAPILQLQDTQISITNPDGVADLIKKQAHSTTPVILPSSEHQQSSTGILNPIHVANAELSIQANCIEPQSCPSVLPIHDSGVNCTAPSGPTSGVMEERSTQGGKNITKTHLSNEEVKLWLAKGQYTPPTQNTPATTDKKRGRPTGSTKKMPNSRAGGYERGMQMLEERAKGIPGRTITRG